MKNLYVGLQHTVFSAGYRAAIKDVKKLIDDDPRNHLPMVAPPTASELRDKLDYLTKE